MTITNGRTWTADPSLTPWRTSSQDPEPQPATGHTTVALAAIDSVAHRVPKAGELTPPRTLDHFEPARLPERATAPAAESDSAPAISKRPSCQDDLAAGLAVEHVRESAISPSVRRTRVPATSIRPASLDLTDLVRLRRERPTRGWRGAAFAATRGRWNPGLSQLESERARLIGRARTQLAGWHSITVSSMKGGIGKTTVAAGLGLTLAEHRGDRIVALDANPDAGTLADRLTGHCGITVRELIDNIDTVRSWTDMAHYTSLAGRLQVLASEQDPAMSEAFSRDEYHAIHTLLSRFYNVIITDSGTGLVHSAMGGALDATNTLVKAGAPTLDGASRAAKTLDWLVAHGYSELVERAVVALSCDRVSRDVDRAAIVAYFQSRCHSVVEIPADPHLAIGGVIELDALREQTRSAYLRLAAAVAEQFTWNHPRAGVAS